MNSIAHTELDDLLERDEPQRDRLLRPTPRLERVVRRCKARSPVRNLRCVSLKGHTGKHRSAIVKSGTGESGFYTWSGVNNYEAEWVVIKS
jgi:hypothetical protein